MIPIKQPFREKINLFLKKLTHFVKSNKTNKSFEAYLKTLKASTNINDNIALLKYEEAKKKRNSSYVAGELYTEILIENLCSFDFMSGLFGWSDDSVSISLKCPAPPITTNGEYDKDKKEVCWGQSIDNNEFASIAYATWAVPNISCQTQHFGRVAIQGNKLCEFVIYYNTLEPEMKSKVDLMFTGKVSFEKINEIIEDFDDGLEK